MNAQELSQLDSPSVGHDPALHVKDILANLADTGWLEKDSASDVDEEGGAANGCPDPDSKQPRDIYDFDSVCPPEQPIFLEVKPSARRRRDAQHRPPATKHKNAQKKRTQAPVLAQRRRAHILHDDDSIVHDEESKEQQHCKKVRCKKNTHPGYADSKKAMGKVPSNDRHEPSTDAAAARDVSTPQNIGSLPLQQSSAASLERPSSSAKSQDYKAMPRGLGEPNNADHLPELPPKHRRKRKAQKENTEEVIIDEVEDVDGPFPILPDFSAKNLAMLRPDVLLRPPEGKPIYRPVPTPESLLLPLSSQHSTQLCAPKKAAAKVQAASQSSMLSVERSDRALAAEAGMHCASGLPPRSQGPASTGTSNKQAQPDSYVSGHPLKRQNRRRAPHRAPSGAGFQRASELVPLNGSDHAAGPQSRHAYGPRGYAASTGELQGASLAAHASVGAMDAKYGSQRTGSEEQRSVEVMQDQNRDQLGVFADCDSEDEDLALDYDQLEQQVAGAAGTCRHVKAASQGLPAEPSSTLTTGGLRSHPILCLPGNAAPSTYGTDSCGPVSTGCPTDVSLREAIRGPHPYEAPASKAAAQLGDRIADSDGPVAACQVVFAGEDEPEQAMDEHWPRAGAWQQAAEQSAPHGNSGLAGTAHWPGSLQFAESQPSSAVMQTAPCQARTSLREPPRVKEAKDIGSSQQEHQPRRRKDITSFDLMDFGLDGSAKAAQPAHPVTSIESGTVNPPYQLDPLEGDYIDFARKVQWNAHGSRAVERSQAHAEDRRCETVFMDEEASEAFESVPAPAALPKQDWHASATEAPPSQTGHKDGTAKWQATLSRVPGVGSWTPTDIPAEVATKHPTQNDPSSRCEIVFADCTD